MTTKNYIDTGDRIVVSSTDNANTGFGGGSLRPEHLGMHGKVLRNDGWGHCSVLLDNGDEVSCWNGANLSLEEDEQDGN